MPTRRPSSRHEHYANRANGFTLLELMVVILLLALVSAISIVSLKEPLARAKLRRTLEELKNYDALVRHWAESHEAAASITWDADLGRVQAASLASHHELRFPAFELPAGMHLERVEIAGEDSRTARPTIVISPLGTSPTYCLRIRTPADEWSTLLFTGLGGQPLESSADNDTQALLETLRSQTRHHAD